jgi:hypothetical protein
LILRHDVDFSLDHAAQQASVNRELGVSATFFVLLSADFYNLASAEGRAALKHLRANGQNVGLHFDASAYGSEDDLDRAVDREAAILASLLESPPAAVSFHRPAPALLGRTGDIAGLPSAYDPKYFREMEYCSDSRGAFHHGEPFDREAFQRRKPFQLLLHPIWWMRHEDTPPAAALEEFLGELASKNEGRMTANSSLSIRSPAPVRPAPEPSRPPVRR